jgi:hypothetical protein
MVRINQGDKMTNVDPDDPLAFFQGLVNALPYACLCWIIIFIIIGTIILWTVK